MTVCDLGSGARCLLSLKCSFEPSWLGCMINYAACFIVHIAKYLRELSAKIIIFLPFGVAFNILLSVISVNLTGPGHTFILAQFILISSLGQEQEP